jgi:hypothetical protein
MARLKIRARWLLFLPAKAKLLALAVTAAAFLLRMW